MPPIVRVLGASGAGKTTLVEHLVPVLARRGLRVGTLKHAACGFTGDRPGSDSDRHRAAGADPAVVVDAERTMLVAPGGHRTSRTGRPPATLTDLCARWHAGADLVLVEGFTDGAGPAVLVHRAGGERRPVGAATDLLCAVTDEPLGLAVELHPDAAGTPAAVADLVVAAVRADPAGPGDHGVTLVVGGRPVPLNPFVSAFLAATVRGAVSALRGIPPGRPAIELRIGEGA